MGHLLGAEKGIFFIRGDDAAVVHRARPRFLPQGDNGDDVLIADDYANRLYGGDGVDSCTASGSGNSVTGCEP